MKLQQLRYIWEVAANNLNVSLTANNLFTSQPGVSKQIRQLEEELGIEIFARRGKHFSHITESGQNIIAIAGEILRKSEEIKQIAQEHSDERKGNLSIATTHTQARYALPPIIKSFRQRYPEVSLHIHQGTPRQIGQMVSDGQADIAICSEPLDMYADLVALPAYRWNRWLLVPEGHPLEALQQPSLEDVAHYPLVTYTFGFTGRSQLDDAFQTAGLTPDVVLTAVDADVIKTYVRLGLGVGIVAHMAIEDERDSDLKVIDASHLFTPSITRLALRRGAFMRRYMFDFIHRFAGHLDAATVEEALVTPSVEIPALFDGIDIPAR
ncbi:HTH-type transcriptional regulator CysB [Carnimonas nigrificans]|uniref:HTH-type transcriptional regulator CysB n=1 Tax=Carnimonas nigrificans TaxID=64323 RepID=UPI00046F563F|nr:HTH-type transcriptional regulator CysB [Carnimonas nigrificans]